MEKSTPVKSILIRFCRVIPRMVPVTQQIWFRSERQKQQWGALRVGEGTPSQTMEKVSSVRANSRYGFRRPAPLYLESMLMEQNRWRRLTARVMKMTCRGLAAERIRLTETYCMLPAYTIRLKSRAPRVLSPLAVQTRPKPMPRVMQPAMTGRDLTKAVLNVGESLVCCAFSCGFRCGVCFICVLLIGFIGCRAEALLRKICHFYDVW